MILIVNISYFPMHYEQVGLCNGEKLIYAGPALGRLDRFEVVGPRAYGGPCAHGGFAH
jgi:hypothetical protein